MGGGAWPFLVGGVICQVNSGNERDLRLLNSHVMVPIHGRLLRGTTGGELAEVGGNNRSTLHTVGARGVSPETHDPPHCVSQACKSRPVMGG
jgi:hypothetical protein